MSFDEKRFAECYQPLFDLMSRDYNLILLNSEMGNIMSAAEKVNENLNDFWRVVCDVEECNETASNQGGHFSETGYWCFCLEHSSEIRKTKKMPALKQSAIDREEKRKLNPNGYLY